MSLDALEPKPLKYHPRWFDRTFSNRSTTEALLAPERDAGNVSHNDYEAAARFSAGYHRHYPAISLLVASALMIRRKPSGSVFRTYSFAALVGGGGLFAAYVMKISAHLRFVRSLENPSGFAQALENIQRNSGLPAPSGPHIVRLGSELSVAGTRGTSSPLTADIQGPSTISPSKWDQIRAVNAHTATNSSWDALRQSHERTRVPSVNSDLDLDFQRSRNEDRAAEQAKFNEMLEREGNIKDHS